MCNISIFRPMIKSEFSADQIAFDQTRENTPSTDDFHHHN